MGWSSTFVSYATVKGNRAKAESEYVKVQDQDDDHCVDHHADENDDIGGSCPGKFHTPESTPRARACPSADGPWGSGEGRGVMNVAPVPRERFPWAGPALFAVVLALVIAFFWWFVQA